MIQAPAQWPTLGVILFMCVAEKRAHIIALSIDDSANKHPIRFDFVEHQIGLEHYNRDDVMEDPATHP